MTAGREFGRRLLRRLRFEVGDGLEIHGGLNLNGGKRDTAGGNSDEEVLGTVKLGRDFFRELHRAAFGDGQDVHGCLGVVGNLKGAP